MKVKLLLFLLVFLFIFLFFTQSCSINKIDVALMTKLSRASEIGESVILMAKLYLKLNPKSRINLEYFNDGWDKELVNIALEKIKKKKIKFLLTTHTSTVANVIMDKINSEKILTIVLGATTNNLSGKDDYHFRLINDVEHEQTQIADFINKLEGKNLILFIDTFNKGYTFIAKEFFNKSIKKNFVKTIYFDATNFDAEKIDNSIGKTQFDIAYFIVGSGFTQIGSIAQILHNKNKDCKIIYTPWVMNEELIKIMGPSYKNAIFSSFLPSPIENKGLEQVKNEFFNQYELSPTIISYKIYEALEILDYTFKKGKINPETAKEFLLKNREIQTYFEKIIFDENGDFISSLFFFNNLGSFYHR